MGRRKIEIKYIENITKREATYSNRRSWILKKANELTILCNAQVFLIMFPKSGTNADYISPSTTIKDFIDRYEKKTKIDLSASENDVANLNFFRSLQNELREQKEINSTLRKEISQRTGLEDLSEFSYEELVVLEEDLRQSPDKFMSEEAQRRHAKREEQGSHLNALNEVPSQDTFKLQPSQPDLHDDAAGGEYTVCSSTLSMIK